MNNYIVRSYRDVIVITKFATRTARKAQSIDSRLLMYKLVILSVIGLKRNV